MREFCNFIDDDHLDSGDGSNGDDGGWQVV